jgi:GNAT superfamily N-acetyltransferase
MTSALELRHYGHDDLPEIRQTLLDVHGDVYAAEMEDEFNQRFPWFVDHWGGHPEFACVIAHDGAEVVGFAYGAPAKDGWEWWREHLEAVPGGTTTFHFSELMVREQWRKTGVAERLHRALMDARDEDLAALLVDAAHPRVQALYESWGYRKAGEDQPFPDSPVFAVMLVDLPLSRCSLLGPEPVALRRSEMANNGVPDTVVSVWAGRSDPGFAKRTYVHPDPQSLEAGSDKAAELLGRL